MADKGRSHKGTKARRRRNTSVRTLSFFQLITLSLLLNGGAAVGADDERFVVIKAGTIITNAGKEIHDGVIVLSGGKIHNVGHGLEYPRNARIIDAHDRVVMPGLINPHTRFGLPPYQRGGVHGDWTVADEYYPPPDVYEDVLDAGYTAIALVPAGEGIPGRALVVRTAGPAEQRTLQSPAYLRVTPDKKTLRGALEKAQQEIEKVENARQEFDKKQEEQKKQAEAARKAEAESKPATAPVTQPAPAATQPTTQPAFQAPPIDPTVQVLVDLLQKKPGVLALIELNTASDFVHMGDVLKKFEITHQFVARNAGESDLEFVADQLGEQKARVIMQPIIGRVPNSAERCHLVRRFSRAGCEVSLVPFNDAATEHRRILSRVAELVREGWSRDEALKALTLHPARLLGLDSRLGSIEQGKDADLIFLDADPFDPTASVRAVMIAGEIVHRVEKETPDRAPTLPPRGLMGLPGGAAQEGDE